MKKTATLILGLLAAGTVFSFAQNDDKVRPERRGPREGGPRGPARGALTEDMKKFDTNGDGKLDREERRAAFAARQQDALAKYDKNSDGKLDESEREAMLIDRLTPRFDQNNDGELDESERARLDAALARLKERRGRDQARPGGRRGADRPGRPRPDGDRPDNPAQLNKPERQPKNKPPKAGQ